MAQTLHTFHIPVMGTGFTADTPIRVAPFGISSVISLVDDLLLERLREYYSKEYDLPYEPIPRRAEDGRARRITAYLNMVSDVVQTRLNDLKDLSFFEDNDKTRYFRMLPDSSVLKQRWQQLQGMAPGGAREEVEKELTFSMEAGSIDVNIMVKLDKVNRDAKGKTLSDEFSDAKSALRGYANSKLKSALVFSAGINQGLYNYMTQFKDFYRDAVGEIQKRIVIKVSDFRSAMIQGRFLARKGLEVHEFRIESGLNCGGHAFASDGSMLSLILQEMREKRDQLLEQFRPMVEKYYRTMGWDVSHLDKMQPPLISVQGGIGTAGEDRRMREYYGLDHTGWASPFLLVSEASSCDETTRERLVQAKQDDLYLSDASPLGVPFNNLRNSLSEQWHRKRAEDGKPGSPCPKGFLISNTEFTEIPICTASHQYMKQKLSQIDHLDISEEHKEAMRAQVHVKACICDHLANGALIEEGIETNADKFPTAICPGPNLAWFNRRYSLEEMIDHIYGRISSLVPAERPHMFVKETQMTVDWYEKLVMSSLGDASQMKGLASIAETIEKGIALSLRLADTQAYPDENLNSIPTGMEEQRARLAHLAGLIKEAQTVS